MTKDEKSFLENMDMLLISGSMSENFYDENNKKIINSFPDAPMQSDIWTEVLNASESGSVDTIRKLLAKLEKSRLPSDEKQWLTTILLISQPETDIKTLRRISMGDKFIPAGEDTDCVAQTSAIIAEKELKRRDDIIRKEYDEKMRCELEKERVLKKIVLDSSNALKEAENNLTEHRNSGYNN